MYDEICTELARMQRDNPRGWRAEATDRAKAWEASSQRQRNSLTRSQHLQRAFTWHRAITTAVATGSHR